MEGTTQRVVYPVAEAARQLGVTKRHVYRLAHNGAFKIHDENGMAVVDATELNAYRTAQVAKAVTP